MNNITLVDAIYHIRKLEGINFNKYYGCKYVKSFYHNGLCYVFKSIKNDDYYIVTGSTNGCVLVDRDTTKVLIDKYILCKID